MRILVLSHEYPPVGGGGGKVAQDLSRGFVEGGHQVRILTAKFKDLPAFEDQEGIEIVRVPSLRKQSFRAGFAAMAGFVVAGTLAGIRQVRRWKPDIIHVHFAVPAGPIAWVLNRLFRIPYVLTAHLGDVPGGVPEKTGKWFRYIFPLTPPIWRRASQAVAVSEFTRQLALANYDVPVKVIPNGVSLPPYDSEEYRVNPVPQIVFAGRFMAQKDPLQLVRILAECKDLDWHCTMMGDGPLMPEVRQLVRAHHMDARFTFPGWVTPEQVNQKFSESDILLMPSLSEGLPVVGVQALAAGLAMVVSDIGGFLDLVEPGINGYLLPPGGGEEWHTSLRTLLKDSSKLAEFRLASRNIAEKFNIERIVDDYLEIFKERIDEV